MTDREERPDQDNDSMTKDAQDQAEASKQDVPGQPDERTADKGGADK